MSPEPILKMIFFNFLNDIFNFLNDIFNFLNDICTFAQLRKCENVQNSQDSWI
jgi:hypothetical protein